ncbi:MAG: potassium channel family protein [Tidjanibacter sp.]|nr:potassium channel family protein [Tidjanibacter sp.]
MDNQSFNPENRLKKYAQLFGILSVVGSILILISLSADIINIKQYALSNGQLTLQLIVCLVFIADFGVHTAAAHSPMRYFWWHLPLLLVSIPYLNIIEWFGAAGEVGKGLYIVLKCLPLVRGMAGIYEVIRYITPSRVSAILWSYIAIIVIFTYLAALLFYSYEEGLNHGVPDFGEALWWAGLNVTTVGANVFAVTTIGKIMTVIFPGLGMILFPLLTVYATKWVQNEFKSQK